MSLEGLGRALIAAAAVLLVVGLILIGMGRLGVSKLPGDILLRRGNTRIFFPIVTGIVISILATIVLNVLLWWWRR